MGLYFTFMSNVKLGKRAAHREDVEHRIVEALRSLIDGGMLWRDVTIAEITNEAQITRTVFYIYFKDKSSVLLRLGAEVKEALHEITHDWDTSTMGPDVIRRDLQRYTEVQRKHADLTRALRDATHLTPEVQKFWKAIARDFIAPTTRRILKERAEGRAPDGPDAQMLAYCLILMSEKVAFEALHYRGPDFDAVLDTAHQIWLKMIYGI